MFSAALIFPLDSDLASACFRAHVDDNIGRLALVGCDEALCKCGDGALIANIDPIFNCVRLFSILFFYHFYPPFFFSLFSLFLCVFFVLFMYLFIIISSLLNEEFLLLLCWKMPRLIANRTGFAI